jgi:hypothetical protein
MELRTDIAAGAAVKRSRKTRLLTAGHLDGRTRGSKRARKLAAELAPGSGPESPRCSAGLASKLACWPRTPRTWLLVAWPASWFRSMSCCAPKAAHVERFAASLPSAQDWASCEPHLRPGNKLARLEP